MQFWHRPFWSSKAGMQRILRRRQCPVFCQSALDERKKGVRSDHMRLLYDGILTCFSFCRPETRVVLLQTCCAIGVRDCPGEPAPACSEPHGLFASNNPGSSQTRRVALMPLAFLCYYATQCTRDFRVRHYPGAQSGMYRSDGAAQSNHSIGSQRERQIYSQAPSAQYSSE